MDQTENKENMEAMEEEQIVVITDDEGNELYFREEMVVPVGKKNFAILAQIRYRFNDKPAGFPYVLRPFAFTWPTSPPQAPSRLTR